MRVVRPADRDASARRTWLLVAIIALGSGIAASGWVLVAPLAPAAAGMLALGAATGLGIGVVSLRRAAPRGGLERASELEALLQGVFDDDYALLLAPRLPGVGAGMHGVLVGPAGVRILTVRLWRGRYRVRGRGWHYDTRGRLGWIPCRTNPSLDARTLASRVTRWADEIHLGQLPIEPVVAFPRPYSEILLEEPADEILTADNAPWWAQRIGRRQRLDPARAARVVAAVMEASEGRRPASEANLEPSG